MYLYSSYSYFSFFRIKNICGKRINKIKKYSMLYIESFFNRFNEVKQERCFYEILTPFKIKFTKGHFKNKRNFLQILKYYSLVVFSDIHESKQFSKNKKY